MRLITSLPEPIRKDFVQLDHHRNQLKRRLLFEETFSVIEIIRSTLDQVLHAQSNLLQGIFRGVPVGSRFAHGLNLGYALASCSVVGPVST